MAGSVKKALIHGRDRMLGRITSYLDEIVLKLNVLQQDQQHINTTINNVNEKVNNLGSFQVSDKEIAAKMFTGLKMYLDPRDISFVPHLTLDGIYEGNISNAWLSLIKPDYIVMDIGANFGYFGALAAQKTNKKQSKVILFEANPNLIPYIQKTFAVNWLNEQSKIENLAISDRTEKVKLNVFKDYIGSSSLLSPKDISNYMENKMYIETQETISVQATTIDEYCDQNKIKTANLIKMDIEGLEEKAYQGMRNIVNDSKDITLFIEFTKEAYDDPRQFYKQLLKDFGYIYLINDEGMLFKPKSTTYDFIVNTSDDWVMPVFSKNSNLAKA
jgi:FkbM family methyltransferase